MKLIEVKPIKETTRDYEAIEKEIIKILKREIYIPLLSVLKDKTIRNDADDLLKAIQTGRITFHRGRFSGRLSATLTRELRRIGAEWDRRTGMFAIPQSRLPVDVRHAISMSSSRFTRVLEGIDKKISEFAPVEIASLVRVSDHFEKALWRVDKGIRKTIAITPELTDHQAKRIASEYTENMQLYIQDFAEKEIVELRKRIQKRAFEGDRVEDIAKEIYKSYGVTERKARFLARQETSLLMTKFKQTRYEAAGVNLYKWACVAGSDAHPVRPMHKALEGKVFDWTSPPVVNDNGDRKNPGQDFGCRCFAIPIVKF